METGYDPRNHVGRYVFRFSEPLPPSSWPGLQFRWYPLNDLVARIDALRKCRSVKYTTPPGVPYAKV